MEQNSSDFFATVLLLFKCSLYYTPSLLNLIEQFQAPKSSLFPVIFSCFNHCFYCSIGLEVLCLNCSGEHLLATCALNARRAGGVIEELSFVAGDNHTEHLSHAFTPLLPIDHSSLECIHACQHPSDAWYLQGNNRTFRIKTYLAAPGRYVCSPKWIV